MKSLFFASGALLLCALPFPAAAQACPPGIASLTLTIGAPAVHVTAVDVNNKCAPLAPGTITWSPLGTPALANGVQDATGWMMTGLIVGTTTATLTSSATGMGASRSPLPSLTLSAGLPN